MFNEKRETIAKKFGEIVGIICCWFISAGFIWWGYSVLAPHLNAPVFTFMEVFAIRMGFSSFVNIFKK